jgi:hypothetical protein
LCNSVNCLKREKKLKKKGKNVKAQQSCSYIDVLSVTWLAKRGADSQCWACAGWSVTKVRIKIYLAINYPKRENKLEKKGKQNIKA